MSNEYEELNALYNYTNNMMEGFANLQENLTGNELAKQIQKNIEQQRGNIDATSQKIDAKDKELYQKMQRSVMQQREIDYKKKLIDTRNRMLQLSQEKNIYKNKVIYTLIATIVLVVMILLGTYVTFGKKITS